MAKTNKQKQENIKMTRKLKLYNEQLDTVDKLIGKQTIEMIPDSKKQVVGIKTQLEVDRRMYNANGKSSSRNSAIGAIATLVGVIGLSLLLFYPFAVLTALTPGTMLVGAGIIIFSSLVVCSIRPLIKAIKYKRYAKKASKTQDRCEELLNRAPVLDNKFVRESISERELVLEKKFNLANQEEKQEEKQETKKEQTEVDKYSLRDDQILNPEMADKERQLFADLMKDLETDKNSVDIVENVSTNEENQENELVLEEESTYPIAEDITHNNEQESSLNQNEVVENSDSVLDNEITSNTAEDDLTDDINSSDDVEDDQNQTTDNDENSNDETEKTVDDSTETNDEVEKTEDKINTEEFVVGNNKDEIIKVIVDPNNSAKTEADTSKYVFSVKYKVYNKQNKGPIKTTISIRENDLDKFIQAIGPNNSRLNNKLNTIDTLSQLSKNAKKNGLKLELVIHATKMLEGKNVTFTSIPYTDGDKFLKIINTLRDSMVKIGTKQLEEESKKQEDFNISYTE